MQQGASRKGDKRQAHARPSGSSRTPLRGESVETREAGEQDPAGDNGFDALQIATWKTAALALNSVDMLGCADLLVPIRSPAVTPR